jgi:hypothetical protein
VLFWDIANIILDILPPSVQEILFVIDGCVHEDDIEESLDNVQWQHQVDAYSRLPELRSVTFSAGECKISDIWKLQPGIVEIIRIYLKNLQSRGILQFYS